MLRLEATLHRTRTERLPCRNPLSQSFERHRAEITVFEVTGSEPARAGRENDGAGLRDGLQTSSKIWRFTDSRPAFRGALGNEISNNDHAGCDTDTGRELLLGGRFEPRDWATMKSSPNRALGIVLVRVGKAEIDQQPITEELSDETVIG